MEAPPRLDRRADDDELRAAFSGDAGDVLTEAPRPRADDFGLYGDAVGGRHRGRRLEPLLEAGESSVHVRIQRQLTLDHERRHQDDPSAALSGEPARKIERVLRLLAVE
jgi:hypothetical protein